MDSNQRPRYIQYLSRSFDHGIAYQTKVLRDAKLMRRTSYLLPLIVLSASFATAALPQKTEGFWAKVLKVLGITATPANQKGDEDPTVQGDIWVYKVDSKLASPVKQGNFSSPIFLPSGNVVLALS